MIYLASKSPRRKQILELSDIKFENLHKGKVLVMCDANSEIICIPGLQVSNKVRVTEATQQILQVEVR